MSGVVITKLHQPIIASPVLPLSKSIINRFLILQKMLHTGWLSQPHFFSSDDTRLMYEALYQSSTIKNLNHAGTCLRFLTAYFATCTNQEVILTGSDRLKQRPIKPLVDALKHLGADISYTEQDGFAPIKIKGKQLQGKLVEVDASTSSQFVTALMLIGGFLPHGLTIKLLGKAVSESYLTLTANVLLQVGIQVNLEHNTIHINPVIKNQSEQKINIETDWSSAAFWYIIAALSGKATISFNQLSLASVQGDACIASIMNHAVLTTQSQKGVTIKKRLQLDKPDAIIDVVNCPDLLPALLVYYCCINHAVKFIGVQTLELKESKRLTALSVQLNLNGFKVNHNQTEIWVEPRENINYNRDLNFKVYNDHRLAMAFACMAVKFASVMVDDATVVAKSYAHFWSDLTDAGFIVDKRMV